MEKPGRIDFVLERLIWLLVLAVLAVGPISKGYAQPSDFVLGLWLGIAAVAVWILRLWFTPQHRLLWPPACYAVLAFTGYAIWRYTQAPIEYVARQELLRVLLYAAMFFVFLNNLSRQEATQRTAAVLITLGMAIGAYAIYQFLTKSEMVLNTLRPPGYEGRASGTYINPNHLAGFLEMVIPMAIAMILAGRFSTLAKVFIGYAGLVMLTALALTISRGGWLAGATGIGFLFIFHLFSQRDSWLPAILGAVLLGCIALGLFAVARHSDAQHNRLSDVRRTFDVRFKVWPAAIQIWKDHPWFGGGPDHFDYLFRKYRLPSDQLAGRPGRVHNDYLNTLADWGVVGAALVAWALGAVAWGFVSGWKHLQRSGNDIGSKRQSTRAALALGAASGVVAILAHSMFDFNMHLPANALIMVCLLAMLSGYRRFSSDRYWLSNALWVRLLATLPLIAWCTYMVPQVRRLTLETRELSGAASVNLEDKVRLDHLKAAFAIEDHNAATAYDVGEHYWREASEGASGYEAAAKQAIEWFQIAARLNPFDPAALVRYGMCLDWLDRHDEAGPNFQRAVEIDPNGFSTVGHMGWHLFQIGRFQESKPWFEKSQGLYPKENPLAYTYLRILEKKLAGEKKSDATPPPASDSNGKSK
jgi:O-antigen ligase